jgi:hypothetical protein
MRKTEPQPDATAAEAPITESVDPAPASQQRASDLGQEAGPTDDAPGPPGTPDEGPVPADRREDELWAPKPEKTTDAIMASYPEPITYVDTQVPGGGCAKMRKTEPQPAATAAQPVAEASAGAGTDRAPRSEHRTTYQGPMTNDQGPMTNDQGPMTNDQGAMLALIAKYQEEFDAALRPYDHLH